jgi:hypothetical protein
MYHESKGRCFSGSVVPNRRIHCENLKVSMNVSQTEIVSLVSQTGDEYLALLLVPCGGSNRIVIGRGVSEIEAHEQLVSEVAKLIANPSSPPIP